MNKEEHVIEFDLLQLLRALWGKAIYIIIATVIFGVLGFVGSKMFITPVYEASAEMVVKSQTNSTGNFSNDNYNAAKNLVNTYAIIIRGQTVLKQVSEELGLQMSYEQLKGCISIKSVNDTPVMRIVVRHSDRSVAYSVAEKLQQISPTAVNEIYGSGSLGSTNNLYSSAYPVSPSNAKNAIMAALVGAALSGGVFVLLFLMDNTYKSDTDLQNDLDVLVLGVIPKVESCGKYSRYGYYGYGYGKTDTKEEKPAVKTKKKEAK